jgi:hypothetical protein
MEQEFSYFFFLEIRQQNDLAEDLAVLELDVRLFGCCER